MAKFKSTNGAELGFDSKASPPLLVLGIGKTKQVLLTGGVKNVSPESTDSSVAKAYVIDPSGFQCMGVSQLTPSELQIEVKGSSKGSAEIQARSGGSTHAKLKVEVYRTKTVKVNFFRLIGKDGKESPGFALAQAAEVLKRMTAIYKPQTRIRFESHLLIDNIKLDVNFKNTDQSAAKQTSIWNALDKKRREYDNADGHLNVFCVKVWGARDHVCKKKDCHQGEKNVIGTARGNLCIVEDMSKLEDRVLLMAHELGHSLNAKHDEANKSALMYPYLNGGNKIYKKTLRQLRTKPKK